MYRGLKDKFVKSSSQLHNFTTFLIEFETRREKQHTTQKASKAKQEASKGTVV